MAPATSASSRAMPTDRDQHPAGSVRLGALSRQQIETRLGCGFRAAIDDVRRVAEAVELGHQPLDHVASRDGELHGERSGLADVVGDLVGKQRLLHRPGRQALDLVAQNGLHHLARGRRNADARLHHLARLQPEHDRPRRGLALAEPLRQLGQEPVATGVGRPDLLDALVRARIDVATPAAAQKHDPPGLLLRRPRGEHVRQLAGPPDHEPAHARNRQTLLPSHCHSCPPRLPCLYDP